MTTNELAAEVAKIAREIEAAMNVFPKLHPATQTKIAIHGDVMVERLHTAWEAFTAQQWKERDDVQTQAR
jgi:hypothetical protein